MGGLSVLGQCARALTLDVIPGEHRAHARDVREGDPGVLTWTIREIRVQFFRVRPLEIPGSPSLALTSFALAGDDSEFEILSDSLTANRQPVLMASDSSL